MTSSLNDQARRAAATRRRHRRDSEAAIQQYVRDLAPRARTVPGSSRRSPNVRDMGRRCVWQKQSRED
jgi:hypothetical protein